MAARAHRPILSLLPPSSPSRLSFGVVAVVGLHRIARSRGSGYFAWWAIRFMSRVPDTPNDRHCAGMPGITRITRIWSFHATHWAVRTCAERPGSEPARFSPPSLQTCLGHLGVRDMNLHGCDLRRSQSFAIAITLMTSATPKLSVEAGLAEGLQQAVKGARISSD